MGVGMSVGIRASQGYTCKNSYPRFPPKSLQCRTR